MKGGKEGGRWEVMEEGDGEGAGYNGRELRAGGNGKGGRSVMD